MPRYLYIAVQVVALAIMLLSADSALATATAVRVLPGAEATTTGAITINRLSAVTSEDSKRAIIAWDIDEVAAADIAITCRWIGRGSGKIIVSSRSGWSHRVSCDGKPTRVGSVAGNTPTAEVYYAGSSKKGLVLTARLSTSRGFATPFGQAIVPTITFNMSSPGTKGVTSDARVVPKNNGSFSSFGSLIPPSLQGIIQQSPFYKYLENVDLSGLGL